MIRSAKMNASTPPKLIPPFHSTAARGTLPIEQTNDSIATSGPISGPQMVASAPWCWRNRPCQKEFGDPGGERTGDQQAAEDIDPDGGPVHHEVVADRGEPVR